MTNFQDAIRSVEALHAAAPEFFAPIETDEDLQRATEFLYHFDFEVRGQGPRPHPLTPLADALMHRITAYEAAHYPVPDPTGAEMLAFMLEQRVLSQHKLARATGIPQSTLSNLLRGKRDFTATHARALAKYFGGDVGMWLG